MAQVRHKGVNPFTLGAPIVVDYSSIISHVAVTPVEIQGCEVLHVLPMDRVSFHFTKRGKSDSSKLDVTCIHAH